MSASKFIVKCLLRRTKKARKKASFRRTIKSERGKPRGHSWSHDCENLLSSWRYLTFIVALPVTDLSPAVIVTAPLKVPAFCNLRAKNPQLGWFPGDTLPLTVP
jgi:hypothetical protein